MSSPLPTGWASASLEDLVRIRDSERIPVNQTERAKRLGDVPYYGATGQVGWINKPLFNDELLLLGEDGVQFFDPSKPKAYLISGPAWVNNHAHVLEAVAGDRRYLKYFLDQADYRGLATGTTRLKLTQAAMKRIVVAVAPAPEQLRIVEELERRLSHVDAAVAGLTFALRRLSAAREYTIWSLVLPGGRATDTALPSLPDGWHWSRLGDVAQVVGGVTKDAKRQSDPDFAEVPYLRVANVQRGYLTLDEVLTIRVPKDKAVALRLEHGDILFNEGGDRDKLGRGWVWEGQVDDCIHQNHVFRARLTEDRLEPKFVSWFGNTFGRRWFDAAGKQTTNLASLNLRNLKAFPIPVPPAGLAAALVDEGERRLSLIDAAERTINSSLVRADQLRRSLLAAAFAGRLVPQDPDDEPASVLLECIRAEREAAISTKPTRRKKEVKA